MLTSLADSAPLTKERTQPINIYVHENAKENIARIMLWLTLLCETGLSSRERMEIFLDIYGNALIRDRSQQYLEQAAKELIQFVTEDDKGTSVLGDLIDLETLKFKERDELEDVFSSYLPVHKFDIEKARDTRMRAFFKERYDYRKNVCDWDYSMGHKEIIQHMQAKEYKDWRMNGVCFETRLASGTIPNRTLGSFIEGRDVSSRIFLTFQKKSRDSVMVRGFWGDIINSPLISFGTEIADEEDKLKFFKQVNYQAIYFCTDVSEYNVQRIIHRL